MIKLKRTLSKIQKHPGLVFVSAYLLLAIIYFRFFFYLFYNDQITVAETFMANKEIALGFAVIIFVVGFFVLYLLCFKIRLPEFKLQANSYRLLTVTFLIIYCLFFTLLTYKRFQNLQSGTFDFGIHRQLLWNIAHGNLFATSIEVVNYLGDHFSVLALIPGMLYALFPHVLFIFFFQALMVTIAAAGIYKMFAVVCKSKPIGIFFMIIFGFYIGVSGLLLADFHVEVIALPLLVWGINYYLILKKAYLGIGLLLLSLLAKEDVGILVGTLGIAGYGLNKDKKGLILAVVAYLFSAAALFIFIPYFRGGVPSDTLLRYAQWGDSPAQIIFNLLTHPLQLLEYLFGGVRFSYFMRMFFPLMFLPLLNWRRLLIAVPSMAVNMLSSFDAQVTGINQYQMMTTAALFFAAAYGLNTLMRTKHLKTLRFKTALFGFLVFFNLLFLPGHLLWRFLLMDLDSYEDFLYLERLDSAIPADSVVFASDKPGAVMSGRKYLYTYKPDLNVSKTNPDFIVVDKKRDGEELIKRPLDYYLQQGYKTREENETFVILVRN